MKKVAKTFKATKAGMPKTFKSAGKAKGMRPHMTFSAGKKGGGGMSAK